MDIKICPSIKCYFGYDIPNYVVLTITLPKSLTIAIFICVDKIERAMGKDFDKVIADK